MSCLVVWQVWPWNADVFLSLRLGEWPQGAVLFALGVHAAEADWMDALQPAFVQRLGRVAALAAAALAMLFGAEVAWGDVDELLQATALGPTILFAALDGLVADVDGVVRRMVPTSVDQSRSPAEQGEQGVLRDLLHPPARPHDAHGGVRPGGAAA